MKLIIKAELKRSSKKLSRQSPNKTNLNGCRRSSRRIPRVTTAPSGKTIHGVKVNNFDELIVNHLKLSFEIKALRI